jgi:hypothetical protein
MQSHQPDMDGDFVLGRAPCPPQVGQGEGRETEKPPLQNEMRGTASNVAVGAGGKLR